MSLQPQLSFAVTSSLSLTILHKYIKEDLFRLSHLPINSIIVNKKGYIGKKISQTSWEIKGLDPSTRSVFNIEIPHLISDLINIVKEYIGDIVIVSQNGTMFF
jgi:hypothetical protein